MPTFNAEKIIAEIQQESKATELDLSSYTLSDEKATLSTEPLVTLKGHEKSVDALVVLPDGCFISGSANTIKLWDAKGNCLKALTGHEGDLTALAVLPDGRFISSSADKATIKLWDSQGKCLKILMGHRDIVHALAVLSDGRFISGGGYEDRTVKLWDTQGKCLATLIGHKNTVSALAVLPDGRFISGSWDKTIKLWDSQGSCLKTLVEHSSWVRALAALPDGRFISGDSTGFIKLWDSQGSCLKTLTAHKNSWVLNLAVLPDGRFLSSCLDNTIKLWDTQGQYLATAPLTNHEKNGVRALAVLPDGRFLSGSNDGFIKLWQSQSTPQLLCFKDITPVLMALVQQKSIQKLNLQKVKLDDKDVPALLKALQAAKALCQIDIRETAISATGVKVLHQGLPELQILHPAMTEIVKSEQLELLEKQQREQAEREKQEVQQKLIARQKSVEEGHSVEKAKQKILSTFNAEKILAELKESKATELDLSTYAIPDEKGTFTTEVLATLTGHSDSIFALAVLPDGRFISGSWDHSIRLWDNQGNCLKTLNRHSDIVYALAVLPDGRFISASRDGCMNLWDNKGNYLTRLKRDYSGWVNALAVLPDGRFLSGSHDRSIELWDNQGTCLTTLRGHSDGVMALAVLPDGRFLSGSHDHTIKLWDVQGECLATLRGNSGGVYALAVLPDGRFLSGSLDYSIKLWDDKGNCLKTLKGHSSTVRALLVLPNGHFLSASEDKTIKLWDNKGNCLKTLEGHSYGVHALAMLPDGRFISGAESIKLWQNQPLFHSLCINDILPILTTLAQQPHIQILNLQKLTLSDEDIPTLSETLSAARNIIHMDIRGTKIGYYAAKALYGALNQRMTIQHDSGDLIAKELSSNENKQDEIKPSFSANSLPVENRDNKKPDNKTEAKEDKPTGFTVSYTINYRELTLGNKLGQGGFGAVYQATWRFQTVAVKQLLNQQPSAEVMEEFKTEAQMMARLRSSHIVQFYGYCESPNYCLVMEYMPKGSLYNVLHDPKQTLDWSIRYQLVNDIACGLAFLHTENILHRDIKSLNVLLDEKYHAKLTDFGLAKIKKETKSTTTKSKGTGGSLLWMAPELFSPRGKYNQKSDIYSLGITLWEIATRELPFENAEDPSLIRDWVKDGERPGEVNDTDSDLKIKDCPKKIASLIRFCWQGNPDKRPEAANIVKYLKSSSEDFASFNPQTSNSNATPASVQSNLNSAPQYRSNLVSEQAAPLLRK